jgi:hypothetical protein
MAKIYNSDLMRGLAQDAGIQQSRDKTPDELAEKIVPVIETNPILTSDTTILKSYAVSATTTTGSIYTSGNGKRIHITAIQITNSQDANSDNTLMRIQGYSNGELRDIWSRYKPTTTAQNFSETITFKHPLTIDPGTLYWTGTFTAGTCITRINIFGFETNSRF